MLEDLFGNSVTVRVLDFFLENRFWDYTKKDISRELGVSRTQLYRIWKSLEDLEILKETRRIGPAKLYKVNLESPIIKSLETLSLSIADKLNEEHLLKNHQEC